jgi:uncharacterized protein with beta-barrel porin domain
MVTDADNLRFDFAGAADVTINAGATISGNGLLLDAQSFALAVTNFGTIDLDSPGLIGLQLYGGSIAYFGSGGFIDAVTGKGIVVSTPGSANLTIAHDIVGEYGVDVFAEADSSVTVRSAEIRAGSAAILMANMIGMLSTIEIAKDASLSGFVPIVLLGDGHAKVIAAGEITGTSDTAMQLTSQDDEVELRSGYRITGFVNAGLGDDDRLTLGGSADAHFDLGLLGTQYLGFETFAKTGQGSWTLNNGSTEAFDLGVEEGRLRLEDVVASAGRIGVGSGARFGGTGSVTKVSFAPGSTFEVATTPTTSDRIDTGTATLGGGRVKVIPSAGLYAPSTTYTILKSTADLTDQFLGVESTSFLFSPRLTYPDGKTVVLTLERTAGFSTVALTPAQKAVAEQFDALGEAAPNFAALAAMTPEEARAAMDQMAGADLSASGGALMQGGQAMGNAALGRVQQQSGALGAPSPALGYSAFTTEGWTDGLAPSLWARLLAGTSTGGGASSASVGLLAGADAELGHDWLLGFMLGAGSSSVASGNTTARSADLSAGVYGAWEWDLADIRFGASLTHHLVSTSRSIVAPGINETLTASYGATTAQFFGEIAHEFEIGPVSAELFGDVGYSRHFAPAFTETGGPSALTVAAAQSDTIYTIVGLRAEQKFALGTILLTARGTLGWKHSIANLPAATNSFAGGTPFQVAGGISTGDALVARAEASLDLTERSGLDLAYDIEWGSTGLTQSVSARYAMTF